MAYVAQLLPDEIQARILRRAMMDWLNTHTDDGVTPESDLVAMHALYAKFADDWHRHNERERTGKF